MRCAVAAALVIVALATCAQSASAAPKGPAAKKEYGLKITPGTALSGATVSFAAAFKNLTAEQRLGSVNMKPPPGYTVQSVPAPSLSPATPGTATLVDGVVQLRSLSLAPSQTATVTMTVTTACSPPGAEEWRDVIVKQANDFNGSPGNDLTLTSNPDERSISTTRIGACAPCEEDKSCETELDAPAGSGLDLHSDPVPGPSNDNGKLTISLPAAVLDCDNYSERAAHTFRFDAPAPRGKVGVLTFDATTRPVTGGDPLQVCFGSPDEFAAKPGTPRPLKIVDGQPLYVGLLPNCLGITPPPCVTGRDDTLRRITFSMPPGDPYSR